MSASDDESIASADLRHRTYDYGQYEGRDWRFFEPVLARMHPAPLVLDLGAGLGLFLECCREHEVPAIGIELSREGVRAAQYSALFQILNLYADPLPVGRRLFYLVSNLMGLALDRVLPAQNLIVNYVVVARK